ncbi:MAG: hypothetical protein JWN14_4389 [Chthonomonadales bacterium]|nr:hypothetical protein [Chthonomonadales bacterium]
MSIQNLINSIATALLQAGSSKIAAHTHDERGIGERAVNRSGRSSGRIEFLTLPPHLHELVPTGTFLGEAPEYVETAARNNPQGIQVVFGGREEQ